MLASGAAGGVVRLWRVSDGALLHKLEWQMIMVYGVAFSPEGAMLASGADDGVVRVWSVK
jgi:WD40 repeat protein